MKRWKEARGAQGEGGCLCVVGVVSEMCVNVIVRNMVESVREPDIRREKDVGGSVFCVYRKDTRL